MDKPMDTDTLAKLVGELLQEQKLTLAVAESCTGGLLGSHITNIPGSSNYFEGGVIAYSYEAKERLLGISRTALEQHGAVSPETAVAMAAGARELLHTDVALAITGIAGPAGGMPNKPVGLVYIALVWQEGHVCKRYRWCGDRAGNREWSAKAALALLHEHLCSRAPTTGNDAAQTSAESLPACGQDADSQRTPVEVRARFGPDGRPDPLAFKWQGRWLDVACVGRTWATGEGEGTMQHLLVITPLDGVFELGYQAATAQWRVLRGKGRPAIV